MSEEFGPAEAEAPRDVVRTEEPTIDHAVDGHARDGEKLRDIA
jgi:hypothetical protein